MNPANPFTTDTTRLADRYSQLAFDHAAKASKWLTESAAAEADASASEETFLATFDPQDARTLADARRKARDLKIIADSIESAGGPPEAEAKMLRSAAVFSTLEKGFTERGVAIEKLMPLARKKLGERRSMLTEQGVPLGLIETDQIVGIWRTYCTVITATLADAVAGKNYAAARGVQQGPAKSFDNLYGRLTAPLPVPPAIPATV